MSDEYKVSRHIGYITSRNNWGFVEKCPYCERTNIKRVAKKQITCGSAACRAARIKAKRAK
jgi:hypothetical protein